MVDEGWMVPTWPVTTPLSLNVCMASDTVRPWISLVQWQWQWQLARLQVSKTEDWNLAVQTLGLQPGSFSRLFLRESLSL